VKEKMIRKNWFYMALIIIYLLFLTKDTLFQVFNNKKEINNYICELENKEMKKEYEEQLKIMNINKENWNVTYSKVIKREIYEFFDKITIDKGSKNNIKKGDIIVNENGLIGIVSKTSPNTSEVALITNKSTNLSVKINQSYGILSAKDNQLFVKNMKIEGEIKEGDEVVTSGLTNVPEGIKIGRVSKVNKDTLELEYILDIDHPSLQELKYVGVISV